MPTWSARISKQEQVQQKWCIFLRLEKHTHTKDDTGAAGALTTACSLHVLASQVPSFMMKLSLLSKTQHCSHTLPARCSFVTRFWSPLGSAAWLSACDSSIPGWQQRDQLAGEAWRALQANAPRQQVTTEMRIWSLRAAPGELRSLWTSSAVCPPRPRMTAHICSTSGCLSRIVGSRMLQF